MTPDIAMVAQAAGPLVAPYIPLLLKAGEGAAEQVGRDLSSRGEQLLRRLLNALRKQAESSPDDRLALEAAGRGGEAATSVLQAQITSVLRADTDLAAQLATYLSSPSHTKVINRGRRISIRGKRVHIKGDVVAGKQVRKGR